MMWVTGAEVEGTFTEDGNRYRILNIVEADNVGSRMLTVENQNNEIKHLIYNNGRELENYKRPIVDAVTLTSATDFSETTVRFRRSFTHDGKLFIRIYNGDTAGDVICVTEDDLHAAMEGMGII